MRSQNYFAKQSLDFLLQKPGKQPCFHTTRSFCSAFKSRQSHRFSLFSFFQLRWITWNRVSLFFWWCSGTAAAALGLSKEILPPFLHSPSPLLSPSPAAQCPIRQELARLPRAGRNQPLAGDGCRKDANPVSCICCVSQDRSPRARRGPCTRPSIPALETLLPQPFGAAPAPRVPPRRAGMQRDARTGPGRCWQNRQ